MWAKRDAGGSPAGGVGNAVIITHSFNIVCGRPVVQANAGDLSKSLRLDKLWNGRRRRRAPVWRQLRHDSPCNRTEWICPSVSPRAFAPLLLKLQLNPNRALSKNALLGKYRSGNSCRIEVREEVCNW